MCFFRTDKGVKRSGIFTRFSCCRMLFLYFILQIFLLPIAVQAADLLGTINDDLYINGIIINGSIDMTQGGSDTVINQGTVYESIIGSSAGSNRFFNGASGSVEGSIIGSLNLGFLNFGGSNTITNYGQSMANIGSANLGLLNVGGSNTIDNYGLSLANIGSLNLGLLNFGSSNTINNNGFSLANIGSANLGILNFGRRNTINNDGGTLANIGSINLGLLNFGGSNTINNNGFSLANIGSANLGLLNFGGSNRIKNNGFSLINIGSLNLGIFNFGGSNTINNYGFALANIGSSNRGPLNFGGSNTINNYGQSLLNIGSSNRGDMSSGGSNTINNYGETLLLVGSWNDGDSSSGGSNTINNFSTVYGSIVGSLNTGANSWSTGNTINNWGSVLGDIWGSVNQVAGSYGGDDTIVNYGSVSGSIFAVDGDDLVILVGGNSLGGVADGGEGDDWLGFDNMGTQDGSLLGTKYLSFENLGIFGGYNNLTGVWDFSTGYVTIFQGSLYINGTVKTILLTVNEDGLLGGDGTIFGDLLVYGTVSPGNSIGTLTVNGYATFMPGSVYIVELASNGAADLIDISGSLDIQGGTVETSLPRALYRRSRRWLIIKADGGVSGRFSRLKSHLHSQTLSLHLNYSSTAVYITLRRKPFEDLAATMNQEAIGAAFDSIVSIAQGDMANLIVSMDFDMGLSQIRDTLAAMSPEMYTVFERTGLNDTALFDQSVALRQYQNRLGKRFEEMSATDQETVAKRDWNVWARFIGNKSERDAEGDYFGHSKEMSGLVMGLDKEFGQRFTTGLSLAHTDSDLDWDDIDHEGSVQGTHVALYGDVDFNNFFITSALGYSDFDNSGARDITFSRASGTLGSDFNSSVLHGRLSTGYDFKLSNVLLTPEASVRYSTLDRDGFTEDGGGYLNLDIQEGEAESLTTSMGMKVAGLFQSGAWSFLPQLQLSWLHEYEDDAPTVTANFIDYSSVLFTVSNSSPVEDYGLVDLSLSAEYSESLSLFLDYIGAFADGYVSHLISGGLAWRF